LEPPLVPATGLIPAGTEGGLGVASTAEGSTVAGTEGGPDVVDAEGGLGVAVTAGGSRVAGTVGGSGLKPPAVPAVTPEPPPVFPAEQGAAHHSGFDGGTTLVAVKIPTGRAHQIRIHMAYAGHPLVGDPLCAVYIYVYM